MAEFAKKRDNLLRKIASYDQCIVAFSAGVDSAVVAKASALALGDCAVLVTAQSASLADGELELARDLATQMGLRHHVIQTSELDKKDYRQNRPDRCFHCKTELYGHLAELARQWKIPVIVNGANADDLMDYRPGMRAAKDFRVESPLATCGFTKVDVRGLAAHWQLSVWDKPATPCLASRVAYGEQVTPEKLRMIDRAEQVLRKVGFSPVRVRYHAGALARLELAVEQIGLLKDADVRDSIVCELKALGFRFVSLDLQGFRSGSLNVLVPAEILMKSSQNE